MLVLKVSEFIIYKEIQNNLNIDYPNFLNPHQSYFWNNNLGKEYFPWGVGFSQDNYLFVAYGI